MANQLTNNPKRTLAIIWGASHFEYERPVPKSVANGLEWCQILADHKYLGLPKENIVVIPSNRQHRTGVFNFLDIVFRTARGKSFDTVIFYYSGHGLRHPIANGPLFLYATDTNSQQLSNTGVPYYALLEELKKRFRAVIVILDCCYSAAASGLSGNHNHYESTFKRDQQKIHCGIFSSRADQLSYDTGHDDFTDFSAVLFKILREGPEKSAIEFITIQDILLHLEERFQDGEQSPEFILNFHANAYNFSHNPRYSFDYVRELFDKKDIDSVKTAVALYQNIIESVSTEQLLKNISVATNLGKKVFQAKLNINF